MVADAAEIPWPSKTREMHNHHINSTVWNDFKFRPDDIVIATWGKSGTTWTQQIIAQLIFNGEEEIDVSSTSPWVDFRAYPPGVIAALEHLPHRRFVKTHLPVDALVFSPSVKYLYVGRDGRDAVWSFYNHHADCNQFFYDLVNDTPGLVGDRLGRPPATVREYYRRWFESDGYPWWPFWANVRSWWAIRDLPNVKLIHFNQMKFDLAGSIRGIASFLDIPIDETKFPAIAEHCTFDYMRSHAELMAPGAGRAWEGGAKTFIHKGTNGRWRDTLTSEEAEAYETKAIAELGPECAKWLGQSNC